MPKRELGEKGTVVTEKREACWKGQGIPAECALPGVFPNSAGMIPSRRFFCSLWRLCGYGVGEGQPVMCGVSGWWGAFAAVWLSFPGLSAIFMWRGRDDFMEKRGFPNEKPAVLSIMLTGAKLTGPYDQHSGKFPGKYCGADFGHCRIASLYGLNTDGDSFLLFLSPLPYH